MRLVIVTRTPVEWAGSDEAAASSMVSGRLSATLTGVDQAVRRLVIAAVEVAAE